MRAVPIVQSAVMLCCALLCVPAWADTVTLDLLGDTGGFEYSVYSWWKSSYTGSDFDPYSYPENIQIYTGNPPWTECKSRNTADRTVALEWLVSSEATLHPVRDVVTRLVDCPPPCVGKAQWFALRSAGHAVLERMVYLDNRSLSAIKPGDTLTLKIERIRMSDMSDLPPDARLRCSIALMFNTYDLGETVVLTESWRSFEMSRIVPDGVSRAAVRIYLTASGDLGGSERGIYVDGVSLFIKHQGEADYEKIEIPPVADRGIKTMKTFFRPELDGVLGASKTYDYLMFTGWNYTDLSALKYLNRQQKSYMYQVCDVTDDQVSEWAAGVMAYSDVKTRHPEWLYPSPGVPGDYVHYNNQYYSKLANTAYQNEFADKAISKALSFRCDGIFIDCLEALAEQRDNEGNVVKPQREPWEVQQFAHAVVPKIRAAGLEVMYNGCGTHLNGGRSSVYFDPFWTPSPPYDDAHYSTNTSDNTPDAFFQEWAFFTLLTENDNYSRNRYSETYWKSCLDDMNAVQKWNTATGALALPANRKKRLHMLTVGIDRQDDPAEGQDGWLQFGYCSFLLAQSEWTSFSCGLRSSYYAKVDYTLSKRLGVSAGEHLPYEGDEYFRYRLYGPSVSGAAGGVVVVNGHTDVSRTYVVEFDGVDGMGNAVTSGQHVVLKPHTGRVFLRQKGPVFVDIRTTTESVAPGEVVTVTVDYLSSSNESALNVVLRAKVPSQMAYVPGSAELSGGSYDPVQNMVSWRIGTVVAGQSGRRTFKATVK